MDCGQREDLGVERRLGEEDGVLLRCDAELVVERVVPDLLHIVPAKQMKHVLAEHEKSHDAEAGGCRGESQVIAGKVRRTGLCVRASHWVE